MDLIYLAFANDSDDGLKALELERKAIEEALKLRIDKDHIEIMVVEQASIQIVIDGLTRHQERIIAFHYSGHANTGHLLLGDENARAEGLATLLGECPFLELVVLNGCSTRGQVRLLKEKKVKAVISTSAPVNDNKAADFGSSFWRNMSMGMPVDKAFNASIGSLEFSNEITLSRGTVDDEEEEEYEEKGLWGLNGEEDALSWRLPSGGNSFVDDYVSNKLLLDKLFEGLGEFDPEIKKLVLRDEIAEVSDAKKREAILKILPSPITVYLRKLSAMPSKNEKGTFFNKPGLGRLEVLVQFYRTLTEMMCFILLAQIWNELMKEGGLILLPQEQEVINDFLYGLEKKRSEFDFIQLLRSLNQIFERENIVPFVEELKELRGNLKSGSPFAAANYFFLNLSKRVSRKDIDSESAVVASILAESKIVDILNQVFFTVRYDFISVRDIKVIKYRHEPKADFLYRGSKLYGPISDLEVLNELRDNYVDVASVLLIKKEDGSKVLNLTPFLIDVNAFKKKDSTRFCFFNSYLDDKEEYSFRFIFKPKDKLLDTGEDPRLKVVKRQFRALHKLLEAPLNSTDQ